MEGKGRHQRVHSEGDSEQSRRARRAEAAWSKSRACDSLSAWSCLSPLWHSKPSPLCGTGRSQLLLRKQRSTASATIVLSLIFRPHLVRKKYLTHPHDAYLRETKRAAFFLQSARDVHTTLPITLMVGGVRNAAAESQMTELGASLWPTQPVDPPAWASAMHKQAFNKLRALELTHYSRVIFVDNDVMLRANVDHLAFHPAPAAVWFPVNGSSGGMTTFNSGVMILAPDLRILRSLQVAIAAPRPPLSESDGDDGSDQELLFHATSRNWTWSVLPVAYNTHRAMCLSNASWADVRILHAIHGYDGKIPPPYRDHIAKYGTRRSPSWVDREVKTFMR